MVTLTPLFPVISLKQHPGATQRAGIPAGRGRVRMSAGIPSQSSPQSSLFLGISDVCFLQNLEQA